MAIIAGTLAHGCLLKETSNTYRQLLLQNQNTVTTTNTNTPTSTNTKTNTHTSTNTNTQATWW